MTVFLYPDLMRNIWEITNNQPLNNYDSNDLNKSYPMSVLHTKGDEEYIMSLNAPFCITLMDSGLYNKKKLFTYDLLGDDNNFRIEKNMKSIKEVVEENNHFHKHDYFELMYVLEGEVEQRIEGGHYLYKKGHASLLNRNTRHLEIFGQNYLLIFLCFSKDFIRRLIDVNAKGNMVSEVYQFFAQNLEDQAQYQKDYLNFAPVISEKEQSETAEVLKSIVQELLNKQIGYTYVVQGLLNRFLWYLQNTEYHSVSHIKLDSPAEGVLFEKITRYMEQQEGRVTRAELAEYLSYNGDYINRIIKKHTCMNISEYNQMICLKKAEQMLIDTNLSITSIISSLGFENRTHFYKLFSNKHGMTPLEYRKRKRRIR
ncbi:AraC family transcriptional regulator [Paenibacillus sp. D2_2]|uniref:AraC family transcriptional regulator n=1 Tax=Paenibacillus sp. D2_2 TaxID=3073092 RepID=UPI00281561B7|nr:AraC family transcriptional regulator [Paenibacillus sp. D2_2]WMT41323.1 AraC family transcriptional regulator [Paenibacillus sp. D2_2]